MSVTVTKLMGTKYELGPSFAVSETGRIRLRDVVSVKDFGAVGDGVADDTAAIQAADAQTGIKSVPVGTFKTTLGSTQLRGPFSGFGRIVDSSDNKRGPMFTAVIAPPTSLGNPDSIETAFNGDLSNTQFAIEHRITGATTLGQPTSGYTYTPEASAIYGVMYTSSGYNHATASNVGRTSATFSRVSVKQYGQGDAVAYNASALVASTRSGSTHFLANPAASLFNGDMQAGAAGVYLNAYETNLVDGGYDCAAIGLVNNFSRTVSTGAKSAVWMGYRAQSNGSAACDSVISATGKWVVGVDLAMSGTDFGSDKAAISLKANDRIYLNNAANASGNMDAGWRTTVFNGDYVEYNSAGSFINVVAGGTSRLQIGSQVTLNANAVITGSVGFYGGAATAKQIVTGSRGSNAALESLLNALKAIGLITDSTT